MLLQKIFNFNMKNPILVERTRGNIVESFHRGAICAINTAGETILQIGDINQVVFTRSALKLFQSIPLIESGASKHYNFTNAEIAVICGSHNAEAEHLEQVNSILEKVGLNPNSLKCGAQIPSAKDVRNELRQKGLKPSDIHNNCSGKHAGFLALAKYLGLDIDTYLDENHPIQKIIKRTIAEMFELPENSLVLGEDGCSAPNYAVPLWHLALGYKNLMENNLFSEKRKQACETILNVCLENPFLLAGTGRYCTEIIKKSNGTVLGKTGADGVFCMAIPHLELGVAIKIDDGKMGPQYIVAQAIINSLGISLSEPLNAYIESPITNCNNHIVGLERASELLLQLLKTL